MSKSKSPETLANMDEAYFKLYYRCQAQAKNGQKAYELLEESWKIHVLNPNQGAPRYLNYATFRVMLSRYINKKRKKKRTTSF